MPFMVITKNVPKICTLHFLNRTMVYEEVIVDSVGSTKTYVHLFGFTSIGTENYSMALIDKTF